MKKFKKLSAIVASMLLLVSISLIQSCKDKENPSPAAKPEITSISPAKAKVGATITITGKNFKAGTEGVSVKVEGVTATVTSATLTSIVCVVPEVAVGPADVIVNINTIASVAYNSFEVLEKDAPIPNAPEITSISPTTALPGASVTITGLYFKEGITGVSVTFAGTEATLTSATTTSIVCTVPQITAGAADVIVTVDGQASAAFTGFTVEQGISISDFEPKRGRFDTIITLTGEKFGTVKTAVKVTVNGKEQEITEITNTQLKVKLAKKTWSGAVKVEKAGVIAAATQELEYIDSYRSEIIIENRKGKDIAVADDGKIYVAYTESASIRGVYVFDAQGNALDTLMNSYYPRGLFLGTDNKMYVSSSWPLILSYDLDNGKIDSIINLRELGYLYGGHIVGDNNNTLYSTTQIDKKVLKTNIADKSTEILRTETEDVSGIAFYNNRIYYTTKNNLISMNTNGSDLIELITNGDLESGITIDSRGKIYTIENFMYVSIVKDGKLEAIHNTNLGQEYGICTDKFGDIYVSASGAKDGIEKIYVE